MVYQVQLFQKDKQPKMISFIVKKRKRSKNWLGNSNRTDKIVTKIDSKKIGNKCEIRQTDRAYTETFLFLFNRESSTTYAHLYNQI